MAALDQPGYFQTTRNVRTNKKGTLQLQSPFSVLGAAIKAAVIKFDPSKAALPK